MEGGTFIESLPNAMFGVYSDNGWPRFDSQIGERYDGKVYIKNIAWLWLNWFAIKPNYIYYKY